MVIAVVLMFGDEIILMDTSRCPQSREEMLSVFAQASEKLGLDIRMQNEALFNAMHRI